MTWAERGRRRILLVLLGVEAAALAALVVAGAAGDRGAAATAVHRQLVSELRLTDLALWPGSSYCRHPSQADLFAPHAEHPAAPEHFPAGSIVPPRPALGLETDAAPTSGSPGGRKPSPGDPR